VVDTFVYDSPFLFPVVDSLVPDSVMGESGKDPMDVQKILVQVSVTSTHHKRNDMRER
jgi:hypothetical protein